MVIRPYVFFFSVSYVSLQATRKKLVMGRFWPNLDRFVAQFGKDQLGDYLRFFFGVYDITTTVVPRAADFQDSEGGEIVERGTFPPSKFETENRKFSYPWAKRKSGEFQGAFAGEFQGCELVGI